jgi:membrane-associated phospholipid phosphatase
MTLLELDRQITDWFYQEQSGALENLLLVLSGGVIYALPLLLIILFFRSAKDRLSAFKITVAAVLSWKVLNSLIGTLLYNNYGFRDRPFASSGLTELFFEQPQKAFPSDHAAVMAAVVFLLYKFGYRRLGNTALVLALVSSLGRVAIGFHWFGDVVAGWTVGIIAAAFVLVFNRQFDRTWGWFERLWRR